MDKTFNLHLCSPPDFDTQTCMLFDHWCSGTTVTQVLSMQSMKDIWKSMDEEHELIFPSLLRKREEGPAPFRNMLSHANCYNENERLLHISSRIRNDYRLFRSMEHYLQVPQLLNKQSATFQVPNEKVQFFIESYWSLDDEVAREILSSKRLTSRSRKDLDEISSTTGVPLRSVTRQFANLKRMYAAMDDAEEEDFNLFTFVSSNYLLSPLMSRKYASIIFLFYSKFTLSKLLHPSRNKRLTCTNFERAAAVSLACLVSDHGTFFGRAQQEPVGVEREHEAGEERGDGEGGVREGPQGQEATELRKVERTIGDVVRPPNITRHESVASVGSSGAEMMLTGETAVEPNASARPEITSDGGQGPRQLTVATESNEGGEATSAASSPTSPSTFLVRRAGQASPTTTRGDFPPLPEGDHDLPLCMRSANDQACWAAVYRVFHHVDYFDPDKTLLTNLRDLRQAMTGPVLDAGLGYVRLALNERSACFRTSRRLDDAKMRSILKALMQLGANLYQSREYRDLFEDILDKVHEPLREAGLSVDECSRFLVCSTEMVRGLPDRQGQEKARRTKHRDWSRFLLCCRLLLNELGMRE